MMTNTVSFHCPSILSTRVCPAPARTVFIVTASSTLAATMGTRLRKSDRELSIVWLPSVASACHRLSWDTATLVMLGDELGAGTEDAINALQAAAPDTRVLLMAGVCARPS